MPTSKKRVKKTAEVKKVENKNPMHTTWGKIMILILVFGFVGVSIISAIYVVIKATFF